MHACLLIAVHFHDGRYHGAGDWPPAPARLFQALVAAAGKGDVIPVPARAALQWLEHCEAPLIAAPAARAGQPFGMFMPNNDLDAKGGDVRKIGDVRTATKNIRPRLFDHAVPLLYAWNFGPSEENQAQAEAVIALAAGLYQLGRGVDMAWATTALVTPDKLETKLSNYPGAIHRPTRTQSGLALDCPMPGSLHSLEARFKASRQRFETANGKTLFSQAPKPRFQRVGYDCSPHRYMFDIRALDSGEFAPWPLRRITELVRRLRGVPASDVQPVSGAYGRLSQALPAQTALIERILIGRGAGEADKAQRVRILPLSSIGHRHADRAIRRVLIEVPPNCPMPARDIAWAFSRLEVQPGRIDDGTGEIESSSLSRLVAATDEAMLDHYGVSQDGTSHLWRSVTPVALPHPPGRLHRERGAGLLNDATTRLMSEAAAIGHVRQALRHVGIERAPASIRVQREPFESKGLRAREFAEAPRFGPERLWHVEIRFAEPVSGPLVIGDGRYCGLGLLAPVRSTDGVFAYAILDGLAGRPEPMSLARHFRRAVMARVQQQLGQKVELPAFFTGHESHGAPLRRGSKAHLAFAFDPLRARLLVVAPHRLEGREATRFECDQLRALEAALEGLRGLRAGAAGVLVLAPTDSGGDDDPLFMPSRSWNSSCDYQPTRHGKRGSSPADVIAADVRLELQRRGLPRPTSVDIADYCEGPRGGLRARVRVRFEVAVSGPMLLGRSCHIGGGLFHADG